MQRSWPGLSRYTPDYGFSLTVNTFNWKKLIARRTVYVQRIHASYENGLHQNRIDLVRGYVSFLDSHTVTVNGETLTAEHILIATGR